MPVKKAAKGAVKFIRKGGKVIPIKAKKGASGQAKYADKKKYLDSIGKDMIKGQKTAGRKKIAAGAGAGLVGGATAIHVTKRKKKGNKRKTKR